MQLQSANYGKKLLTGTGILLFFLAQLFGCSNLSVFMPSNPKSGFHGIESVRINDDGKFLLSWNLDPERAGKPGTYAIYLLQSKDAFSFTGITQNFSPDSLTINTLTTVPGSSSPHTLGGKLIGKVSGKNEFVFDQAIDPNMNYLFQVLQEEMAPYKALESRVIQAKASFHPIQKVEVKAELASLDFFWAEVGGANTYDIFADKSSEHSLGQATRSSFSFADFKSGQEICIRPRRGEFVAPSCYLVNDLTQGTMISRIVTEEGIFGAGAILDFKVQTSGLVDVDTSLELPLGATGRVAQCLGGTGLNEISCTYTIKPDDNFESMTLGPFVYGSIKNKSGLNIPSFIPPSYLKPHVTADTTAPKAPSSVGFNTSASPSTVSVAFVESEDLHFSQHRVKLCTASDCNSGCLTEVTAQHSPVRFTSVASGIFHGCVMGEDLAGNHSAWVSSLLTFSTDTLAPTVLLATSTEINKTYINAETIDIQIKFSEPVYVTNENLFGLLLETGTTDRTALYRTGSGTDTLTFRYTVQVDDLSSDLNYASTNALNIGLTGSIRDAVGNNALLALPDLLSPESLAGAKSLVVDAKNPSDPSGLTFPDNPSPTTAVELDFTDSTDSNFSTHNVKLCPTNSCAGACVGQTTDTASPAIIIGAAQSTYYGCVQGVDLGGNVSAWIASASSVKVGPTFTGVASGVVQGSFPDGTGKLELTFLAAPAGVTTYNIYFSTLSTIGSFDFTTPIATVSAGNATYDSNATDNKLLVPIPISKLNDGYYVVRYASPDAAIVDTNTAISSLVNVLTGHPNFVLVPRAYSRLAYDYYMMRYEATLASGAAGADAIDSSAAARATCNYEFHVNKVSFHSSCGPSTATPKATSLPVTPQVSITYDNAFTACRRASDSNAIVRLPTQEEWKRATQWRGSIYSDMWATYADGTGNNCNSKSGSITNSGSKSSCVNALGIYDAAGNVSEWVDTRMSKYTVTGPETRFGYAPSMQRVIANGIDNVSRRFHYLNTPTAEYAMTEGADFLIPTEADQKQFGSDVQRYLPINTSSSSVGFRCLAFNTNDVPTMTTLSLPSEPVYSTSDYTVPTATRSIPENFYAQDNKWENLSIAVTGNTADAVAEGNISITWNPWNKTTCNPTCTTSSAGLTYKIYRFTEPNRTSNRITPLWALSPGGSNYATDKPIDPLAVNAAGSALYTAATTDGKLIATNTTCIPATPGNCIFVDSVTAGTGFSPMSIYDYVMVVVDSAGNEVVPMVQKYRSPYFAGPSAMSGIPSFRLEQRIRRASVFLVDEEYQQALSNSQIMVYVPMNISGMDHDYFIQKYEGTGYGGAQSDNTSEWPYESMSSWSSRPAICEDTVESTGAFGGTCLANIGDQINTTWSIISKRGQIAARWCARSSYFKGCRDTKITDGSGQAYNMRQPSDSEWWKAADWGDVDQDGIIDQNPWTGNVLVSTVEGGASDSTTVRCHTDNNPTRSLIDNEDGSELYPTGSTATTNCRSRYGAADMVGNLKESVNGVAFNGTPLDNGVDGLFWGATLSTVNSTSGYTLDPLTAAVAASGLATFFDASDEYYMSTGNGLTQFNRGGTFDSAASAGRSNWELDTQSWIIDRWSAPRCSY